MSGCDLAVEGLAMAEVSRHILHLPMRFDCWNNCCDKAFKLRRKWSAPNGRFDEKCCSFGEAARG
jgi:hypothetical protein